MALLDIEEPNNTSRPHFALFALGFRPFFLGASICALFSMTLWMLFYALQRPINLQYLTPFQWHAHEMIFGYGLAVVAGFLLTAVRNWTNIPTISGAPLMAVFMLWGMARILATAGDVFLSFIIALDSAFLLCLVLALAIPLIQAKQYQQFAILSKIVLILACYILFALGAVGELAMGIYWGLYGAFFLLLSLVFTLARRVLPFFIERGVGYPIELSNSKLLDASSLVLFLSFAIEEVFLPNPIASAVLAGMLAIVHSVRLVRWHTYGIWKISLLWSFYIAMWFMVFAFVLYALMPWFDISKYVAIHAFAVGGLTVVSVSMMARISLGHTGRNVSKPPMMVKLLLAGLLIVAVLRVIFPLLFPVAHVTWILIAQGVWIVCFVLFIATYAPIWWLSRVDGKEG